MKFRDFHPTTKRLMLARAFRSVGQGALVVDLALYLHSLGWSGFRIGLTLSGAGLLGAAISLTVGVLSDRLRRRPFLLFYEGLTLACALAAFLAPGGPLLAAAVVLGGFGRGANGAAGPFSPVEQAWLAEEIPPAKRGGVYSLNTAMGFFGMGLGSLAAMLPSLPGPFCGNSGYRMLFLAVAAATLANLFMLSGAAERHDGRSKRGGSAAGGDAHIRRRENRMLTGLVLLNSLNGLAVGLTGPLISYWFARRFHAGPETIAPVMAAGFFVTGGAALLSGKLSERVGIVTSVVWARALGLALLLLLPLAPTFALAAAAYVLRSALNRGSVGARQALTVGLVRDERRGLATSLNAVSMQLPQSLGPSAAGFLFGAGQLELPFFAGAVFQGAYLAAYAWFFRGHNKPRDGQLETAA